MSAVLSPEEAVALLPGLHIDAVKIRELSGGLTNRTYRIDHQGDTLVLRLDATHTKQFGLDRLTELLVLRTASAAGLAPAIVHADPQRGILLTRFLPGRIWSRLDLQVPARVEALAALLRRVHALPSSGVVFDARATAARYAEKLPTDNAYYAFAPTCLDIIGATCLPESPRLCHNDVVAGNLIGSSPPMLLDWEYACDNDPLFDLASLIGYHDLDYETCEKLLLAFAGDAATDYRERLQVQLRLYDALQWLWLAKRQSISPDDHLRMRLEVLRQRMARQGAD